MTLLLRDALLVPNEERPFVGWLLIDGPLIAAVGRGEPPGISADRVLHCADRALIPGLVNAHAHSHSSLTRGSAEGLPLEEWLGIIEAEQRRLSDEQAYIAALATYTEMLMSGTTTVVDMCLRPAAAVRAAIEIGIRAVIVPYVADSKPFTPTLRDVEQFLDQRTGNDRVQVWVGLHDLESCSDEQVGAGVVLARKYGVGIHLHCSETRRSVERTRARTGRTPVEHLRHLGALTGRTLLAHCVWVDERDRAILAETGASVVHCPHPNLKLGSGIAPAPEMCKAGLTVALGTDGAKANNSLDMFEVMKLASLIHKGRLLDPAVLRSEQVLGMATAGAAKALGITTGDLKAGLRADITAIRLDRFHLQPATPETIPTNLVHAARGSDVDLVIINGNVVAERGVVQTLDTASVQKQAAELGRSLLS